MKNIYSHNAVNDDLLVKIAGLLSVIFFFSYLIFGYLPLVFFGIGLALYPIFKLPVMGLALIGALLPFNQLERLTGRIDFSQIIGFLALYSFLIQFFLKKSPLKKSRLDLPIILLWFAYLWGFVHTTALKNAGSDVYSNFISMSSIFLLYFLVTNTVKTKHDFYLVLTGIFMGSTLLTAVSLWLYFFGSIPFSTLSTKMSLGGALVPRLSGFSGDPNNFSTLYTLVIPLAFVMLLNSDKKRFGKIFIFFLLAIFTTALLLSYSRSAWIAISISIALITFSLLKNKQIKLVSRYTFVHVILLAILIGVFSKASQLNALKERTTSLLYIENFGDRPSIYLAAVKLIALNPLGVGLEKFCTSIGKYGGPPNRAPHNSFIKVGGELGWFGLICLLWIAWRQISLLWFLPKLNSLEHFWLLGLIGGSIAFWIRTSFNSYHHWGLVWLFFGLTEAFLRINLENLEGNMEGN